MIANATTTKTLKRKRSGIGSDAAGARDRAKSPKPAKSREAHNAEAVTTRRVRQRLVVRGHNAVVTPNPNNAGALNYAPMARELRVRATARQAGRARIAAA